MPPQKLSDSDKQEILTLYRQTEETTTTLASRYGVSNTTISRILKQIMTEQEYDAIVQQKRSGIFRNQSVLESPEILPETVPDVTKMVLVKAPAADEVEIDKAEIDEAVVESQEIASDTGTSSPLEEPESSTTPQLKQRKRLTPILKSVSQSVEAEQLSFETVAVPIETSAGLPTIHPSNQPVTQAVVLPVPPVRAIAEKQPSDQPSLFAETQVLEQVKPEEVKSDLLGAEEEFDDLDDDEHDDDDENDDDLDDEDLDDDGVEGDLAAVKIRRKTLLQVLPLSEASIPKTFYLVVDRASELITRPLQDFAELGQVPAEEVQSKTLPIFDNHRVARRFSRRMQRVVKVPDGKVLEKVGSYLQAKGITRLLIDGQVYSV
jgi:transposase-like protein